MSNPNTPTGQNDTNSPKTGTKSKLTDAERSHNHSASEAKRRQQIRRGFDRIAEMVPGQQGKARSEAIVLQAAVAFSRTMIEHRENLRLLAAKHNWTNAQFETYYNEVEQDARVRNRLTSDDNQLVQLPQNMPQQQQLLQIEQNPHSQQNQPGSDTR